ncbi:4-hydroxy-tetrahydrodipicolinate reductase [Xylocopilactobacillus apis]|uniref:4-hydroxy-tetrahydrodipicolinate reductase n=1 Tax=Xylocopilactobacillus apis TaxID=2932183 RepID=A0AAU9D4T5_9LACO|nr:4-hydroxy-tetrahydrodipicolinate reductase [Xylocopilactobacillus apis]BDR55832.1 4-hydroxy-tetrahydrodipicolinate reductase [Xylocopilactobacillus apis]
MKKIIIAGITGSMGKQTEKLVSSLKDCELVGAFAPHLDDNLDLPAGTKLFSDLKDCDIEADIWIDFTVPSAVFENTKFAIEHKMRPIIGTSGLDDSQISELQNLAAINGIGGIIAPNFGLSAVLLMKFVKEAAKYFPDAEVIEMHHADKLDAPSGTAIKTAQIIAESRNPEDITEKTLEQNPARGADYEGIKIHSVRLPGYVAHEQVLFGGPGEALTIRQDSFDRSSFMQGVKVAIEQVMNLTKLIVGLEKIL